MYCSKEDYENVCNEFFKKRHGIITKLSDSNGKIYGYMLRCECDSNKHIAFCLSLIKEYKKIKSLRNIKFCMYSRILNKWKHVKEENYLNFKQLKDEKDAFKESINAEILQLTEVLGESFNVDINETSDYIVKNVLSIENYYKNDDFSVIIF